MTCRGQAGRVPEVPKEIYVMATRNLAPLVTFVRGVRVDEALYDKLNVQFSELCEVARWVAERGE